MKLEKQACMLALAAILLLIVGALSWVSRRAQRWQRKRTST